MRPLARLLPVLSLLLLGFLFLPSPALAGECEDCGITDANLDYWLAVDPSGDGKLTTFDLVLLRKFVVNINGGFCLVFKSDVLSATDFDGDGVWTITDARIRDAILTLFDIQGNPATIDLCQMIRCLQLIILGSCP